MRKKVLVTALVLLACAALLCGCQRNGNKVFSISRTKGEANGGENISWSALSEKYAALKYVPALMDPVDFYKPSGSKGAKFGFLEVDKPEAKYDELRKMLENVGFVLDENYDGDFLSNRNRSTPEEKAEAVCKRFYKDVDGASDGVKRVYVCIEYFALKYKNSRNVFIRISG